MLLPDLPFTAIDWDACPAEDHPGETGTARWHKVEVNGLRLRRVDYSPGYRADHWCDRGHVFLVQSGSVRLCLRDGRETVLTAEQGFAVSSFGDAAHLVESPGGARVLILD